jgi:GT2 family glycosyltransferase
MAKRKRRNSQSPRPTLKSSDLDIIIPVYGQPQLLRECVQSLLDTIGDIKYQLIIVDDGSPEPDGLIPEDILPDGTKVLRNRENKGFPFTVNRGVNAGNSPLILLLNSDIKLQPGCIQAMMQPFSILTDKVGVVGAKLVFPSDSKWLKNIPWQGKFNGVELVQHAGISFGLNGPFHRLWGWPSIHPKVNVERELQAVTGALFMTRRIVWTQIAKAYPQDDPTSQQNGGFNLVYSPGTYEEVEFCLAARSFDWKVVYQPQAVAEHHVGASIPEGGGYPINRNSQIFQIRCAPVMKYDEFISW